MIVQHYPNESILLSLHYHTLIISPTCNWRASDNCPVHWSRVSWPGCVCQMSPDAWYPDMAWYPWSRLTGCVARAGARLSHLAERACSVAINIGGVTGTMVSANQRTQGQPIRARDLGQGPIRDETSCQPWPGRDLRSGQPRQSRDQIQRTMLGNCDNEEIKTRLIGKQWALLIMLMVSPISQSQ